MQKTLRPTTFALGSLAVLSLAGCSAQAEASTPTTPPASSAAAPTSAAPASSAPASSAPASSAPAAAGGLKDGTYSATGDYQSPGGPSAIGVTVTLKSGVVTALTVTPKAEDATAVAYEKQFASGVDALVVGKKLTALNVTKVSGSSLTSQGFDAALATIEAAAKA